MRFSGNILKNSHIRKIFTSFFAMALILIGLIGVWVSTISIQVLKANSISANQNLLTQFGNSIDLAITQADSMMFQFIADYRLRDFIYYHESLDIDVLSSISAELQDILLSNRAIHSIFIYFPQQKKVYIANSGIISLEESQDRHFLAELSTDIPSSWTSPRTVQNPLSRKTDELISMVRPVQYLNGQLDSVAIINLNTDFFTSMFDSVAVNDSAFLAFDSNLVLMASSSDGLKYLSEKEKLDDFLQTGINPEAEWNGTQLLFSRVTSQNTGWTFLSITQSSIVYQGINRILTVSVSVILIGVLLSIAFSIFASRRFSAPFSRFAKQLNVKEENDKNILLQIEEGIKGLKSKNESIEKALLNSMPILKNNFSGALLNGVISTRDEIEKNFSYYNIQFSSHDCACVLIIKINNLNEDIGETYSPKQVNTFTVYILQILENLLLPADQFIICTVKEDEIIIIAQLAASDPQNQLLFIEKRIEEGLLQGHEAKHILAIGIGSIQESIYEISKSYHDARYALAMRFFLRKDRLIISYDPLLMEKNNILYPYMEEKNLLSFLQQNKLSDAYECIDRIMSIFFANFQDNEKNKSYCILQLLGSLLKFAHDSNVIQDKDLISQEIYQELFQQQDDESIRLWFHSLAENLLSAVSQRQIRQRDFISSRITEYIDHNYSSDLSMSKIAEVFHFSIPHISRLYHDETGSTIKQYITKVRMEKACFLLTSTKLKISDIGQQVGYEKVHGFLKQFKEVTGMTPKEYREKNLS